MIIQSTKPERSESSTADAVNPAALPTDFLFNLLMQNINELPKIGDNIDLPVEADAKEKSSEDELVEIKTTEIKSEPSTANNENILLQINLVDQFNKLSLNKDESFVFKAQDLKNQSNAQVLTEKQSEMQLQDQLKTHSQSVTNNQLISNDQTVIDLSKMNNPSRINKSLTGNNISSVDNAPIQSSITNKQEETNNHPDSKEEIKIPQELITKTYSEPKAVSVTQMLKDIQTLPESKPTQLTTDTVLNNEIPENISTAHLLMKSDSLESIPFKQSQLEMPTQPTFFFNELSHFINNQSIQLQANNNPASNEVLKTFQMLPENIKNDLAPAFISSEANDTYTAKIKIYPPELGAVIAKLKINKNNAEVVIVAENNQVKQIVDANLPQLKQHFQNANFNLTDIQVQVSSVESQGAGVDSDHKDNNDQKENRETTPEMPFLPINTNKINQQSTASDKIIDTYI